MTRTELRLEDLLGREVHGPDDRRVGRIEEFRAERQGDRCVITAFVIGAAGLVERFGVGARLLAGRRRHGYVAAWNQIDLTTPERPRLTCALDDLETI